MNQTALLRWIFLVPIMIMVDFIMRQITPTSMPLLLFKPMGQSWRGVTQVMEAQHPLVAIILRFIQMALPLLPLKPMGQSRCGVTDFMEARMHLLAMAIPRFIQL
ncbi:hypothetical protein [uncultured Gammaproteobacteria bacterium]|nr:hypothetical protein [uncultured Gammaproteobacteria bacterium]